MSVLVTGFGPFEDVDVNASGRVAERLSGRVVAGHAVVGEVLPTAFGEARARIARRVRELEPAAVVALGVARDPEPRIERRATAVVTSARPDVAGEVWQGARLGADDRVIDEAALARWLAAARRVDAAVRASDDCGGYVCNAVHHALLEATDPGGVPAVFVHIPRATDETAIDHIEEVVVAVLEAMVAS